MLAWIQGDFFASAKFSCEKEFLFLYEIFRFILVNKMIKIIRMFYVFPKLVVSFVKYLKQPQFTVI